ncbi:MAG: 23S rRNA (guanosine(2251)-2'-O)-methyltransferase RlmB [Alphaproteobacteria bacterium]|nr:23S rRNA (guanosine(2251)-2'-O)-methyltransferase RlmB [Alphaproteobacteria bacterium]
MKKRQKTPHNRQKQRSHKVRRDEGRDKDKAQKVKIDLFGHHAVVEAWLNPARHIHVLYLTDKAAEGFEDIVRTAQKKGLKRPEPIIIDRSVLDHSTPMGSVHQGIGLNVQALEPTDIHDLIRAGEVEGKSLLVMLDQVTDPHNVGAILRSACVFGATGLIMQKKHAPELTGVLAKTACGGVEHVPVAYETNLTRSLETLQEAGYMAIGLDERGEQEIGELERFDKVVIVLGAEGPGLRRLVREQCDILTRLPTNGPISSLNVSNAAAVALYALKN